MSTHILRSTICIAALAAGFATLFGLSGAALAQNPCKSENPLDADDAYRHADCGETDKPGWGTYQFEREQNRIPDETYSFTPSEPSGNDYLPTSFTAFYDSMSPGERQELARRIAEAAGLGDRNYSGRELDAYLTVIGGQMDDYLNQLGLDADGRREAIAEFAREAGIAIEPKATDAGDYEHFGRGDAGIYEGWERVDPTDPSDDGFGRPQSDARQSDIDPLADF